MKEPRRLVSDAGTSPLGRSLLTAGRARRERPGARERVWGAVGVAVAGGVAVMGASASAGASASVGGSTGASAGASAGAGAVSKGVGLALAITKVKLVVAAVVLASATAGGAAYLAHERHESAAAPMVQTARMSGAAGAPATEPHVPASTNVVANAVADVDTKRDVDPTPEPSGHADAKPNVPRERGAKRAPADAARSVSELREEAELLGEVRAALAAGDGRRAATRLEEARTRFPRSRLGQERDALEVRAATANGDRARASSLGRAFVARYPESPLRPGIEASIVE